MSGIYIPNYLKPKSCRECEWCVHTIPADNYICYRMNRAVIGVCETDIETVNVCCPILHVPDHGDLIDRTRLYVLSWTEDPEKDFDDGVLFVLDKLDELPAIIPAEGEDYT